MIAIALAVAGCSDTADVTAPDGDSRDNGSANHPDFPNAGFFQQQIADRFQFDTGYMPTGSPAHRNYVDLLAGQLRNSCAIDVTRSPFQFTGWYYNDSSLTISDSNQTTNVPVLNGIPYSDVTDGAGITAPVIELPALTANAPSLQLFNTILLDDQPIEDAISDYDVDGKIVLAQLPNAYIAFDRIIPEAFYLNDPDNQFPDEFSPTYLAGLLAIPQIEAALKQAGASAIVAALPDQIPGKLYAPYSGAIQGIPGVYLTRDEGQRLRTLLADTANPPTATLTIDADVEQDATLDNLSAVVPGSSDRQMILASHTDGTNVIEENGPAAILGLVRYFCGMDQSDRPVGLRIVLTGSHHAGNKGLEEFIADNQQLIEEQVFLALEIEHLGGLKAQPTSTGRFETTGDNSPYIVALSSDKQPLVDQATLFSQKLNPSIVGPPPLLNFGAGAEWAEVTNSMQFISGPSYLLSYDVANSAVVNQFMDFALMRKQTQAIATLITNLAKEPAAAFADE